MKTQVGNYTLIKSLGKGSFGEVYLTQRVGRNRYFATKKIDLTLMLDSENAKGLSNELNILKIINNPYLVKLEDLMRTSNNLYIVMEYCNGGDLSKCLKKYLKINKKPFSEEIVQYLMRQIITGLRLLHSKKILHRDLKLDNILINFNSEKDKSSMNLLKSTVKISDFGFSKILKDPLSPMTNTIIGTPIYMCPSMLAAMASGSENPGYNQKADIWSLGVLCYEMLIGECPFIANDIQELYNKIKQGDYSIPTSLSREAADFIGKMLLKDQDKRLSCDELLKHDFLNKNINEFKPVTVMNIQGVVAQKGQFIIVNSGANDTKIKLEEKKVELFNQINPKPIAEEEVKEDPNKKIEEQNQQKPEKKKTIPSNKNKNVQQNKNIPQFNLPIYRSAAPTFHTGNNK